MITPNHVSDLDGLAIAAALPWSQFRRLYWAGDVVRMFSNPLNRLFCRAMHVFPVDAKYPGAALESARRVLKAGDVQVWFPEAWRSPDGRLQRFLPGIGQLLLRSGAPAVPAYIGGAFEALPRGRRIPKASPDYRDLRLSRAGRDSCARPAPAGPMRSGSALRCASGSPRSVPRRTPVLKQPPLIRLPAGRRHPTMRIQMLEGSIAVPISIAARHHANPCCKFLDRAPGGLQGRGLSVRRRISELR